LIMTFYISIGTDKNKGGTMIIWQRRISIDRFVTILETRKRTKAPFPVHC